MPNDQLSFRLISDYTKRNEHCCAAVQIALGAGPSAYIDRLGGAQAIASAVNTHSFEAYTNRSTAQHIEDAGLSGELRYKLSDNLLLTSITSARHYHETNGYDDDFTTADLLYRNTDGPFGNQFKTISQEIRLNGHADRLDWLLGLYLEREDLKRHSEDLYGKDYESYMGLLLSGGANINQISQWTGLPVGQSYVEGLGAVDIYKQTDKTAALFTNLTYHASDKLDLILGLRDHSESKTFNGTYTNTDNGKACAAATALNSPALSVLCLPWSNSAFDNLTLNQARDYQAVTGTLKATYQVSNPLMGFVSYNRGFKAGGFNLDREQLANNAVQTNTSFASESVDDYEAGLKWHAGNLSLDADLFDEQFKNFQLNTFLGTTFIVDNVPNLRSKGVEFNESYMIKPLGLALNSSLTYDEARFGPQTVDPALALLPNNTASFAPKWSLSGQADYHHDFATMRFEASLDGRFNSPYNTGSDLNPIKEQKAYSLWNGRLALTQLSRNVTVALWSTNMTNVRYYQVAFAGPFQGGTYDAFLGRPRAVGVSLGMKM